MNLLSYVIDASFARRPTGGSATHARTHMHADSRACRSDGDLLAGVVLVPVGAEPRHFL